MTADLRFYLESMQAPAEFVKVDLDGEVWRFCYLDSKYEVSSMGRMRNASTGRPKKMYKNKGGYLLTGFETAKRPSRKIKNALVHRVVWEAFNGPVEAGLHVRHLDGDSANNRLSNLALGSPKINAQDKVRVGTSPLQKAVRGECSKKLDVKKVREIREMSKNGQSHRAIAAATAVSRSLVGQVLSGQVWRWVK